MIVTKANGQNGCRAAALAFLRKHKEGKAADIAEASGYTARSSRQALGKLYAQGGVFRWGMLSHFTYTLDAAYADAMQQKMIASRALTKRQHIKRIGAILGAIASLDDIRIRCEIDGRDEDPCWIWKRCFSGHKSPAPTAMARGRKGGRSVARLAIEFATGKPMERNMVAHRTCDDHLCVNPEHLKAITRAELGRLIRLSGAQRKNPIRVVQNTLKMKGRKKIEDADLCAIRDGNETAREAANRLGVGVSCVHRALSRPTTIKGSSIFAWRPE